MGKIIYEDRYGVVYDDRGRKAWPDAVSRKEFSAENKDDPKTKTERTLASHWKRFGTKSV